MKNNKYILLLYKCTKLLFRILMLELAVYILLFIRKIKHLTNRTFICNMYLLQTIISNFLKNSITILMMKA